MPLDKSKLNELLRELPQVEAVLSSHSLKHTLDKYRRDVVKRVITGELAKQRDAILKGKQGEAPGLDAVAEAVISRLRMISALGIRKVINASGVILHTNLGRAVLSERAQDAIQNISRSYCDLEINLGTGKRSHRDYALEELLVALTGCESATVVNNNAAAVFLVINTFAKGKEVITSRGELVEIGGSFRVPDVVASSGATLVEVGTTNRTRIGDFENAVNEKTGLLLKTHTSNYRVRGFVEEVSQAELIELGKRLNIPVFNDLGSGLIEGETKGQLSEPGVLETLADGPDLISFSGDKLLGGPQAGIILGSLESIASLRKNPLWRVLRIDKFTASALAATLSEHLENGVTHLAGIAARLAMASLENQAKWASELAGLIAGYKPGWSVEVVDGKGTYGGGSVPDEEIDAKLLRLQPAGIEASRLDQILRTGSPAVTGYLQQGALVLNMLSLLPGDVKAIADRIAEV